MPRTISIGAQSFEYLRANGLFYVDKTGFARDWWLSSDQVTLVCRPRRFGKTLNLDTVRCFFSTEFQGRGEELFGGTEVWRDASMRALQGTIPVVLISFAEVKEPNFEDMARHVSELVADAFDDHPYLAQWGGLTERDRVRMGRVGDAMDSLTCTRALNVLCDLLYRFHGKRPIVLLDEYDTPMEHAWTGGYWDEASSFMRRLMNSTFKTNRSLGRGLITGVTRVSRESIFSDLNNLEVVTISSLKYRTSFGFVQAEVDEALLEYGLGDTRAEVRRWYDGFTFGGEGHVYNPWSLTKYLESGGVFQAWWANTSSNGLVSSVVRAGDRRIKADFEELMRGKAIDKVIDEQIVFGELQNRPNAIWALLLAAGYLTSPGPVPQYPQEASRPLALTNLEVRSTFDRMVQGWFDGASADYDDFASALLSGDAYMATRCLAEVTLACMSSFDGVRHPAQGEPERFYHGLVLGLLASLRGRYSVESNRESGWGRYDVALVPVCGTRGPDPAVLVEFKVFDPDSESTLADTVARARKQIEDKAYATALIERGIAPGRIRAYGIAFRGKEVLVG